MVKSDKQRNAMNSCESLNGGTNLKIQVFVYGTLKKGCFNHNRFCRNAVNIEKGVIWGRLYHLPAGYPAIEIPKTSIMANGSTNPIIDTVIQNRIPADKMTFNRPLGDWDLVQGEIISFSDPLRDLSPIDRLEGFSPSGGSLYRRSLITSRLKTQLIPVWVYWFPECRGGTRVNSGKWIPTYTA